MQIKYLLILLVSILFYSCSRMEEHKDNWEIYICDEFFTDNEVYLNSNDKIAYKGVYFKPIRKIDKMPSNINFNKLTESILSGEKVNLGSSLPWSNVWVSFIYWNKDIKNGIVVNLSLVYKGYIEIYLPVQKLQKYELAFAYKDENGENLSGPKSLEIYSNYNIRDMKSYKNSPYYNALLGNLYLLKDTYILENIKKRLTEFEKIEIESSSTMPEASSLRDIIKYIDES